MNCAKYLVNQFDDPEKKIEGPDHEEFLMRIPVRLTGANQILPVKFNIICSFTVNSITFNPP